MRLRLALVKSGVPWDVAFSLPKSDAVGMAIIFGEMDGGVFDFAAMKWVERKR